MRRSWVIGSSEKCDIRLSASVVSGTHCRLSQDGDAWFLEDLGSRNGTFVDGQRVQGVVKVAPGDQVTLGQVTAMPWPHSQNNTGARTPCNSALMLPTNGRSVVIGRSATCDVIVPYPMVSGRHAEILSTESGCVLRDLGSSNGTYAAGRKVTRDIPVKAGDTIGLGSHLLILTSERTSLGSPPSDKGITMRAESVSVEVCGRRLIDGVSCVVRPGEMIAIMGPSGAGKSTLLTALVGMQRPVAGRVLASSVDIYQYPNVMRGEIGYVPQEDIMHSGLTVEQALWYSARLRLPTDYTDAEIRERVDGAITRLGLEGTRTLRIGSASIRGISGGQRKRVNIAMELLTDPPVIVLDEPTSGLSSNDSLTLIRLLHDLANGGKTIILTIHQPSIDILRLMSGLAVIARDASSSNVGRLVWYGPAYPHAARFFEPEGAEEDHPDAEAVLRGLEQRPVQDWISDFEKTDVHQEWVVGRSTQIPAASSHSEHISATFSRGVHQLRTLIQRMIAVKHADRSNTTLLMLQAPGIAVLIVLVLAANATTPLSAANWSIASGAIGMTAFLMALSCIWFGCANAIREIVSERAVFRREYLAGVGRIPYLGSKLLVLGTLSIIQCSVLLAIVRWGCGLRGGWMEMILATSLGANIGVCIGLIASSLVRSSEAAATLLPVIILPMIVLGGALLPVRELSTPMACLASAVPSRWAFEGVVVTEALARPCLESPDPDDPTRIALRDIADGFFPTDSWRAAKHGPVGVLSGMWLINLVVLYLVFRCR